MCSPNNPTGKVFNREELEFIAELCQEFDTLAITDEIYEHILYDGAEHIPIMTIPGMRDRTVLVNSMSKTYAVTGWRVGWVLASPDLSDSIRKVHDFLTVGAAAPLQAGGGHCAGDAGRVLRASDSRITGSAGRDAGSAGEARGSGRSVRAGRIISWPTSRASASPTTCSSRGI